MTESVTGSLAREIDAVLDRTVDEGMRRGLSVARAIVTRHPIDQVEAAPWAPGLHYFDPVGGNFGCEPAAPNFTGESLDTLDLRVLAAYLATSLDTVNAELKKRM